MIVAGGTMMRAQRDDLRLLSIFHFVLAGLASLFALFPVAYVAMGAMMLHGAFDGHNPPPAFFGWFIIAMGAAMMLFAIAYVVALVIAGRCIARERHWMFVIVVAALSCAFFPFGTTLGVFTIVALSKPEVKSLFQHPPGAGAPMQTDATRAGERHP